MLFEQTWRDAVTIISNTHTSNATVVPVLLLVPDIATVIVVTVVESSQNDSTNNDFSTSVSHSTGNDTNKNNINKNRTSGRM